MTDERFALAIDAVRAAGDGNATQLAAATRERLRRSLDNHAKHRRRFSIVTIAVLAFGGTVAWAVTTGHVDVVSSSADDGERGAELPAVPMKLDEATPKIAVAVAEPPAPPPPEAVEHRPRPIERLYRKAHELHFQGSDYTATLAAWDAYLAAEPKGRFAVEAKFNRALVLIRLGRYAAAQAALAPFAAGAVQPADYRRDEARRLVDRLERLNGSD